MLRQRANGRKPRQQNTAKLVAGHGGMLGASAEQIFFLRAAGGMAGVVPVLWQFDSGLRSYAFLVFVAI